MSPRGRLISRLCVSLAFSAAILAACVIAAEGRGPGPALDALTAAAALVTGAATAFAAALIWVLWGWRRG